MTGELLDHDRRRAGVADAQVEHRAGVREHLAQHARVDLERDRVLAAAVHDAGHLAFPAQPPSGPRTGGLALRDRQRCGVGTWP